MSSGYSYTKLFSSLTTSTIWRDRDYATKIVWITLLAMADKRGRVWASVPGLADAANVSLAETERALDKFKSPDKYSRTEDFEGRRIEDIRGGWRLLNYEYYRSLQDEDERRMYKAAKQAEYRRKDVDKSGQCGHPLTDVDPSGHIAEAEAEAEAENKPTVCSAPRKARALSADDLVAYFSKLKVYENVNLEVEIALCVDWWERNRGRAPSQRAVGNWLGKAVRDAPLLVNGSGGGKRRSEMTVDEQIAAGYLPMPKEKRV